MQNQSVQTNPALALVAELIAQLPGQATSSIIDGDGYESEQFNLTIQQHPITGTITVSVRPGSPLESPTHFGSIQAISKRHGAAFGLPTPPKPKRPKRTTHAKPMHDTKE